MTPSAKASGVRSPARYPESSCWITKGTSPTGGATTGNPQASASRAAIGIPSNRDVSTRTSAPFMTSGMSWRPRYPTKWT